MALGNKTAPEALANLRGSKPAQAFDKGSLGQRVLAWLSFCALLTQPDWQNTLRAAANNAGSQSNASLAISPWVETQPARGSAGAVSLLLILLGVLFGTGTMVGALSYSGSAPVNLWLMLALFAILPFVLTLSSVVSALRLSAHHPPFLLLLVARLAHRVATGLSVQQLLGSAAGRLWLLNRLQWFGVVFQTALIVTFMAVLLFNDVAFGWSSTLLRQPDWLPTFFAVFTWPWHWWVDSPSDALIAQSQFYRGSVEQAFNLQPAVLGEWWPHIVLAMTVYGLLPRVLLMLWLGRAGKAKLRAEIARSTELASVYQAMHRQHSVHAKMPPSAAQQKTVGDGASEQPLACFTLTNQWLVSWQRAYENPPSGILGLQKWQDDEQWLREHATQWLGKVYFLVQEQQVPTAELADILTLVTALNPRVDRQLLVQVRASSQQAGSREHHQRQSWQYFAAEQGMAVTFCLTIERQPNGGGAETSLRQPDAN